MDEDLPEQPARARAHLLHDRACGVRPITRKLILMSIVASPEASLARILEEVLSAARAQGLSQKDLSARAGVRPETVARAKSRGTIEWPTLQALAAAAGVALNVQATLPSIGSARPAQAPRSLRDGRLKLAWSNPDAPTQALIAAALQRAQFDLILLACKEHGIGSVRSVLQALKQERLLSERVEQYLERALHNIEVGAQRAGYREAPAIH